VAGSALSGSSCLVGTPTASALPSRLAPRDIVSERGDAAIERVRELTYGLGAHSVLECVGHARRCELQSRVRAGAVGGVGVLKTAQSPTRSRHLRQHHDRRRARAVRTYIEDLLPDVLEGRIEQAVSSIA
jgi:threonine dehydrogenase-like Zn-dependent dehydrogenase